MFGLLNQTKTNHSQVRILSVEILIWISRAKCSQPLMILCVAPYQFYINLRVLGISPDLIQLSLPSIGFLGVPLIIQRCGRAIGYDWTPRLHQRIHPSSKSSQCPVSLWICFGTGVGWVKSSQVIKIITTFSPWSHHRVPFYQVQDPFVVQQFITTLIPP